MDDPPARDALKVQRRLTMARTAKLAVMLTVVTGCGLLALHAVPTGRSNQTVAQPARKSGPQPATWNPDVRVNLTPAPRDSIQIRIDGPYSVVVNGTARVLGGGQQLREINAKVAGSGIRLGTLFPISELEIRPVKSPAVWVGRHQYRGSVILIRRPGDKLIAVNRLPLEHYIASVVNSEMPASFPDNARRAQAIVARTYALSNMKGHPHFDVFASTRSQKYLGYQYYDAKDRRLAGESSSSRAIAADTTGIVCTSGGRIFTTYYTAVCGGRTVNGHSVFADAASVIRSVECNWCREAGNYRWDTAISRDEASRRLAAHFQANGQQLTSIHSIRPTRKPLGDLPHYLVSDGTSSYEIAGSTLRRVLPSGTLISPSFSAEVDANEVRFAGRGHGHGVGLCQWGARGLAQSGRSTLEILRYYYPGSGLVRLRPRFN